MNFKNLKTTKLGDKGETYIPEFCTKKSVKCYQPSTDGPYPVDSIILHKNETYGLEAKTKPRRVHFADTGFDTADFHTYLKLIKDNVFDDICILFIDSVSKKIWYQWMSKLEKFADIQGNVVYFPLTVLNTYRDLTDKESKELLGMTNSKYY
jgi:hypothetical protein